MNRLIIVSGPTASGKTRISIEIAKFINEHLDKSAVIVNFDSLLFYKEISIGTAKPTQTEQSGIPHFMIDIESISTPMNAADFIKKGESIIKQLLDQQKIVILVGGSAFYLRALLKGMYESVTPTEDIIKEFELLYQKKGIEAIIAYLQKNDPAILKTLHHNDHYRLNRAAIHFAMTGSPISDEKKLMEQQSPYDFSNISHPWEILHLYLDLPRDQHFSIIQSRTKKMFEDGLMGEIDGLEKAGFKLTEKPLNSIGYKEAIEFRNGFFQTLEECIERISISTRQLAKSQRTFFNKITPKYTFNPLHDKQKILQRVEQFLS